MTLPTEGLNDLNHLKKRTLKDADKLTSNINDPQLAHYSASLIFQ